MNQEAEDGRGSQPVGHPLDAGEEAGEGQDDSRPSWGTFPGLLTLE